uniref:hypothetical protein n=1 Tax=Phocaeicola plebeius TaxID=310297 RepID=UPI0026F0FA94
VAIVVYKGLKLVVYRMLTKLRTGYPSDNLEHRISFFPHIPIYGISSGAYLPYIMKIIKRKNVWKRI